MMMFYSSYAVSDLQNVTAWHDVLRLATEWKFASIRELAIDRLGPIVSDVDKVVFGHAYKVDGWVMQGYMQLVERENPITCEEGNRLGVKNLAAIAAAREEVQTTMALAERDGGIQVDRACGDADEEANCPRGINAGASNAGKIGPRAKRQSLSDLKHRVQTHIPWSTIVYHRSRLSPEFPPDAPGDSLRSRVQVESSSFSSTTSQEHGEVSHGNVASFTIANTSTIEGRSEDLHSPDFEEPDDESVSNVVEDKLRCVRNFR